MSVEYFHKNLRTENTGNNAFAWEYRREKYGKNPSLTLPSLIEGALADVEVGDDIVFEELEDGILKSCKGVKHFVRIKNEYHLSAKTDSKQRMGVRGEGTVQKFFIQKENIHEKFSSADENRNMMGETMCERVGLPPDAFGNFGNKSTEKSIITIFDNHNHALYFWIEALRDGIIEPGCTLIHIDEHSDLWTNTNHLDLDRAIKNLEYAWEFTNLACNVGNYIEPAIKAGLIGTMIRIENEYQIDEHLTYIPPKNTILNIDLDFFAPELDHIPEAKKIQLIKNLLKYANVVTIATSPYFIEQGRAIEKLHQILTIKNA